MKNYAIFIILLISLIFSCGYAGDRIFYILPGVIYLSSINSNKYDSFNAVGPPQYYKRLEFIFSRKSLYDLTPDFDVYKGYIDINFYDYSGNPEENIVEGKVLDKFIPFCDSEFDELGPIIFSYYYYSPLYYGNIYESKYHYNIDQYNVYLFGSNRNSNYDIFVYSNDKQLKGFFGNTTSDELYPCYDYKRDTLYFCSNKEGVFNIYKFENKTKKPFSQWLTDDSIDKNLITKVEELSSSKDDKCPYVFEDIIFFVSNRDGGKGGFDIYYSKWSGGKWSTPKNLQDIVDLEKTITINGKITVYEFQNFTQYEFDDYKKAIVAYNTLSDEYRPTCYKGIKENDPMFLIFSSNRYYGNFNLYLAILPKDF